MKTNRTFLFLMIFSLLLAGMSGLSACSSATETPTPASEPATATVTFTAAPTQTPPPIETPSPTATLKPTETVPAFTETATATATRSSKSGRLTKTPQATKTNGLVPKPTRTPKYRPTEKQGQEAATKIPPKGYQSPTPSLTHTPDPNAATSTKAPTYTSLPATKTAIASATPLPSSTPVPNPGATATKKPGVTRIAATTPTPVPPSATPTITPTLPSPTPTKGPTPTATNTPLPTPPPIPVAQYSMNITMDYAKMEMDVVQNIKFSNLSKSEINEMLLSVQPNRISGVFKLQELRFNDQIVTDSKLTDQRLSWTLGAPFKPGATAVISLKYHLTLPKIEQGDPNIIRPQIFGVTPRQVNLTDWYPMLVPYQDGKGWLLHEPWQFGEHLVYPLGDYDVFIRFKDPLNPPVVAASGEPQTDLPATQGSHFKLTKGRDFVFSMGMTMKVLSAQVDQITIKSYFFPGSESAGKAVLNTTVQSVKTFTQLFGPYPHQTLTAVQGDFNDGMEFEGLYFLSKSFYDLYDGGVNNYLVMIAAHETSHQWWFARIANDQNDQPWLDEALATYCEKLYYEYNYPQSVSWWWNYRINFYQPKGKIDGSVPSYQGLTAYTDATYRMGAKFLEELRQVTGDRDFLAFFKDYATQMDGKIATTDDFFRILRQNTRANLTDIIAKYFTTP